MQDIRDIQRVAFYTLGCKLNFAETSMISRQFIDNGYKKVSFDDEADVYIINTCSVTQVADKKCRNIIRKASHHNAKVVVIGCYSQLFPEEIAAIEGVSLVLGTSEKFNVVEHLESLNGSGIPKVMSCSIGAIDHFEASYSTTDRTRAFLKVQDGCDYTCAYCTIPLARGKSRNENISATVKKAESIAKQGIKEIVLTGVNTGDFGKSTGENFIDLLRSLEKIEGISRYRISSIEPNLITDTILEFIAGSMHFARHFHIPLQSGSDQILASMGRRYNTNLFHERIKIIRQLMPDACIGADVIVGFPGETGKLFDETFNFIKNTGINYLHVFPYSERKNTKAVLLPGKVDEKIKNARVKELMELSESSRQAFYLRQLGTKEIAIFESRLIQGKMTGFTGNYIKVESMPDKSLIGKPVQVMLKGICENGHVEARVME